jgi:plastocyanin
MTQLKRVGLVLTAVCLVAAVAVAAASGAGKTTTVKAVGKATFKPNVGVSDTQHWSPGTISVASGGRVTWKNATRTGDPHTITIVRKQDLPKGFDCAACDAALRAHGVDPATGRVANPVVNVGAAGLDAPGDSLVLAPHGRVSATVSAPAGTTLYYVCSIHPWMQGRIHVHR